MEHPRKRHAALKPLNKEHHQGLLLCWKLREAKKRQVPEDRVKNYLDYFYDSILCPHLAFEEEKVYVLLGEDHPLVRRAIAQHKRLHQLFCQKTNLKRVFRDIEIELETHIRFEEHILFNELQQNVSEEKLNLLREKEGSSEIPDPVEWHDQFWKSDNRVTAISSV